MTEITNVDSYIERLEKPAGVPPFIQREVAMIMRHQQAEIERLTAERDRQYDQNCEQIIRIAKLEAALRYCGGRLDHPRCPRCGDRQQVARAALKEADDE